MKITVLTIFPELIEAGLNFSIPKRARESNKITVESVNWRQFAIDKRGTVDDAPYGGGAGMVLRVDVAHRALKTLDPKHQANRIMLSPDGEMLSQAIVSELTKKKRLLILCGRYEGFDRRIEDYIDKKISIGPYVVSGGELPALIMIDAIARLLPGVLGNPESLLSEAFTAGPALSDFPVYTRPAFYNGKKVPEILLSGNHAQIADWRRLQRQKISTDHD